MPINPLAAYRQAQLKLHALFDPFTREQCPVCETPCCRKPARIRPVDIILVEELGFSLPRRREDPLLNGHANVMLEADVESGAGAGDPCEYLGAAGCSFPTDLRPFGCAAMICDPMWRLLPPERLELLQAAVAELESAHAELMQALQQPL